MEQTQSLLQETRRDEQDDHESRRFQVYNVGLAKTGTTSISRIFEQYQTGHEFLLAETGEAIKQFQQQQMTEAELRDFLRQRDEIGKLEMDATFCHGHYLPVLADEFPDARFIFTVRDCYSWVDSVINMVGTHRQITHLDLIFGLPPDLLMNPEELRRQFPEYIDRLLALWSEQNRTILDQLPADRSLILRTHEISQRVDDLARFVGVPEETLNQHKSHEFKAPRKLHVLQDVDADVLEEKVQQYGGDLMREFFPGYSLRDFLQGEPIQK